jgi:PAS domain S-box-containing protein
MAQLLIAITLVLLAAGCQPVPLPNPAPTTSAPQGDHLQNANILILNAYHVGYQWSEDIVSGIRSTFAKNSLHPELYVEYMDTKRYTPEEIFPILVAMYASKYKNVHLDLIISVDNTALSFLATYHDQLFPGVPVVFVGVNGFTPDMLGSLTEVTGITESLDEAATIDLIPQLLPEIRHLAIINDGTITGEIRSQRFHELEAAYEDHLDFRYLSNLSSDELAAELRNLPEHSAIFFGSFFRDRLGESLTVEEALHLINANSNAPILTTWDFTLGEGVLGGALLTGRSQGEAAANLAIRILQGTSASSLPLMQSSPTEIILDYNELQRFNIPLSAVPASSTIINRPKTFYREYQTTILAGGSFLIVQTLVIVLLVVAIRRRRRAEQRLSEAETRLDRMLQTVVEGVVVLNRDHTLAYLNPSARELLDIPEAIHIGDPFPQPVWTALDDLDRPLPHENMPLMTALHENRETNNALFRFVNNEGEMKWLAISAAPIIDEEGHTVSAIASLSDVTSRQFAAQDIQKSERRFRTLFEQVIDSIIIVDLNGQIVDVNQRTCDMLGYTRAEILKMNAFEIAANTDKNTIQTEWSSLTKGKVFTKEGYHRDRQGQIIPVELNIGLIDLEGKDQILIISRDITERKQTQQKLLDERALLEQRVAERTVELQRLNAELHQAARAKDEFLANMSHELRTPLNAILGMSEMLSDELHGPLNERQLKYMKIIEESGRHLLDLINDILDLSKIEAGQLNLFPQPIQIDDICRSTLSFMQQAADKKHIQIILQDHSSHTRFVADPRAIKQILVNLMSNAIKFSPEEGLVDFVISDAPEQDAIRFSIRDRGIGIPPDKMVQLFKPFYQIDSSLSRNYEGSGLGLALVARLVALHGGSTSLESSGVSGEGSTFTITLPLSLPEDNPPALPSWTGKFSQTNPLITHVLLAENNETSIQVISDTLQTLGCQVDIARTGMESIQTARHYPPQVILLNMQMPDMDGWQILAMLKNDPELSTIPVLALTSQVISTDAQRYKLAGVDTCLALPFQMAALLKWIKKYRPKR